MSKEISESFIPAIATIIGAVLALIGVLLGMMGQNKWQRHKRSIEKREDVYMQMAQLVVNYIDEINRQYVGLPGYNYNDEKEANVDKVVDFFGKYKAYLLIYVNTPALDEFKDFIKEALECEQPNVSASDADKQKIIEKGEKVLSLIRNDLDIKENKRLVFRKVLSRPAVRAKW